MVGRRPARLQIVFVVVIPLERVNAAIFRHAVINRNVIQAVLFNICIESLAGTCKRRYQSTVQCLSNEWKQFDFVLSLLHFPPTEHTHHFSFCAQIHARRVPVFCENKMFVRMSVLFLRTLSSCGSSILGRKAGITGRGFLQLAVSLLLPSTKVKYWIASHHNKVPILYYWYLYW